MLSRFRKPLGIPYHMNLPIIAQPTHLNRRKQMLLRKVAKIAGISRGSDSQRSLCRKGQGYIARTLLRILVLALGTVCPRNVAGADSARATPAPDNEYCSTANTWIGGTTDGPANLPTACNNTALSNTPSPGSVRGPDSTTLAVQNDLNVAACGDTIKITAGATINAITLPAKGCDNAHWITLESSGITSPSFPAEGTRVTPCVANVASLPGRPAYPCPTPFALMANIQQPTVGVSGPVHLAAGADHYRLIGLEISRTSSPGIVYDMVDMTRCTPDEVCVNHVILDRIYCHGVEGNFPQTVGTATETKRCVNTGQANHVSVIDSYLANFYCAGSVGACDSQAIAGGFGSAPTSGWGVIKIVNNHLEGAAEGILFGGANGPPLTPTGCTIGVNCNLDVPTDGEVRRNNFFKPTSWESTTGVTAGWPVEKNGFEMKIGARWLFEGNVIENTWPMGQIGQAIVIAPKNQGGGSPFHGTSPTALTNDFTYRYNYAYNVGAGLGIFASQDSGCSTCRSQGANRISIHDLLIDWLNLRPGVSRNQGDAQEYTANLGSPLQNIAITHVTIISAVRSWGLFGADSPGLMSNWTYRDNIVANGNYGLMGLHTGSRSCDNNLYTPYQILNACVTPYTFDHNVIMDGSSSGWPTNGKGANNFFVASKKVQFADFDAGNSNFNPQNYILQNSSPYHLAASDGKDVGADIPTLRSKIAGVRQ